MKEPIYADVSDEEILETLERVLEIDPNNSLTLFQKADILSKLKRYDEALLVYKKVLDIDSSSSPGGQLRKTRAHSALGSIYLMRGELVLALKELQNAHKLDKYNINVNKKIVETSYFLQDFEGAKPYIDIILEKEPDKPENWYLKYIMLRNIGEFAEAEKHLKKLLELNPDFNKVLEEKADISEKRGLEMQALGLRIDAVSIKAVKLAQEGKINEVEECLRRKGEYLERIIEHFPKNQQLYFETGLNYYLLGQLEKGNDYFKRAEEIDPDCQIVKTYHELIQKLSKELENASDSG